MPSTFKAAHIIIVDDDPEVRATLKAVLAPEGFAIAEAGNGHELMAAMKSSPPDLITLDLNLSGEDGLKLAREIRSRWNVPMIMVTGKSDPIDRVVGLELGADDYITKPFHLREVLAQDGPSQNESECYEF